MRSSMGTGPRLPRRCCEKEIRSERPSLSIAASDAEIGGLGEKMSSAFRCSTYAQLFDDQKEQQRLLQIDLKAVRGYVEGIKSPDNPTSELLRMMRGVSTSFVVGQMYESESTHA